MTTQAALTVVDAIADDADALIETSPVDSVRTQAAFVRALVEEVECRHPGDHCIASLRQQLSDELMRLAEIVRSVADPASLPRPPAQADLARATDVLVVDDDAPSRETAVRVLVSWGYTCREAESGPDALAQFDRAPAAIVLADWAMPEMSGLELCTLLKQRTPPPYVILVTAFHDNARLLEAVHGGADDFLQKPLDLGELEARLFAATRLLRALDSVSRLRDPV